MIDEYRKKIETIVTLCNQEMIDRIYQILSKVVMKMEMELKQHLFRIIETLEFVLLHDVVRSLFKFIDARISSFNVFLIRPNYIR